MNRSTMTNKNTTNKNTTSKGTSIEAGRSLSLETGTPLETRIKEYTYDNHFGVYAIEKAYAYATERLLETNDEKTIILDTLAKQQGFYQELFGLYFSLNPTAAEEIVHQYRTRYQGWRTIFAPLERWLWTYCKQEQYNAAKKIVKNLSHQNSSPRITDLSSL